MTNLDVVRAWKDDEYHSSLSDEDRQNLPENPAGLVELSDEELGEANGGTIIIYSCFGCIPSLDPVRYCTFELSCLIWDPISDPGPKKKSYEV
ncbi:MAG: mersacidin/lichenicidin family type 2 lantibiotic [Acidobacteria bacterium]|nr:mersacidin/lichenicidin family type 2 lantibiotic [Acidobacteriota bacterium]